MCDLFYIKYPRMLSLIYFFLAALAEISGCFAFWAWQRLDKSIFWLLPGSISLLLFAWLLTLTPTNIAGRSYAIYGGIYIFVPWDGRGWLKSRYQTNGISLVQPSAYSAQRLFYSCLEDKD